MELVDCDAIVTIHGFIFYVVGYEHPEDRVMCNLKYVPINYAKLFDLEWLDQTWYFKKRKLIRPKVLFSSKVYKSIIKTMRKHFSEYIYYSANLRKYTISVPKYLIEEVYKPNESLKRILNKRDRDFLESKAIEFITELSRESRVPIESFGISGSIGLGMHRRFSDMDIIVYGSENYYRVLKALKSLESKGLLTLSRSSILEKTRLNRGVYKGTKFNVNAVRSTSEISSIRYRYNPICTTKIICRVINDYESIFRPAVYKVKVIRVFEGIEDILRSTEYVVSMIGIHRMIARTGDIILVKGMLEEVIEEESGLKFNRVFVGSGFQDEYIANLSRQIWII